MAEFLKAPLIQAEEALPKIDLQVAGLGKGGGTEPKHLYMICLKNISGVSKLLWREEDHMFPGMTTKIELKQAYYGETKDLCPFTSEITPPSHILNPK
jgi:hypothetical protein